MDTLKAYDNLIAADIPENQARAQVYLLNSSLDGLATKEDVNRIEVDVKEIKSDIKKFMWGSIVALLITGLGTLIKIAFHL
jgi:hypothetical protein